MDKPACSPEWLPHERLNLIAWLAHTVDANTDKQLLWRMLLRVFAVADHSPEALNYNRALIEEPPLSTLPTTLPLCCNCLHFTKLMRYDEPRCSHPEVIANTDLVEGIEPVPCKIERKATTRENYDPHKDPNIGLCGRSGRLFTRR